MLLTLKAKYRVLKSGNWPQEMPVVVLATLWGGTWLCFPAVLRLVSQAVSGEYTLVKERKHTTNVTPAFFLYISVPHEDQLGEN